jgi:hypothetical protein
MYNLSVQGYVDMARMGVLDQRKISRDPLSGLVDKVNTVFQTTYYPLLTSGSLQVYTSGSLVSGTADYNTGEITFDSAPLVQPKATYTFTNYTTDQLLMFMLNGFDEMELRWEREWKLVDQNGNLADQTSGSLYVVDANGNDPTCGVTSFSQSRVQVAFFLACVEYRMRLTQFGQAANTDYSYRSTGGITVDKSKRPSNFDLNVKALDGRLARALKMAQEQYYVNGENYGAWIGNPSTLDYLQNFEWQSESKDMGYGAGDASTAYIVNIRRFGVW